MGMVSVITLYALLILHLLNIAMSTKKDYFVKVFASGMAFLFFIYMVSCLNDHGIGPVVGLPLPMFSLEEHSL